MQLPWVTLPEDKRGELWANAINSVGDSLVGAAQTAEKRKKEAADLLLKQREADRMDANSAAERDNLKSLMAQREGETNRNAVQDHLAATKEIMSALDAGQTDRAHAIATAYRTPLTQAPPTPGVAEEGPQATPEIAQQAGKIRAEQASFEPGAGPDSQYTGAAKAEMNRFAGAQNPPSTPGAYSIGGASYDPAQTAAAEESKRAEEAKRAKEAFAPVGYGAQAAAIATTGAKPGEIGSLVTGLQKSDQVTKAREEDHALQRQFNATENQKYKSDEELKLRLANISANARIGAAREIGNSPSKADSATRGDYTAAQKAMVNMDRVVGLPKLVSSDASLRQALDNIKSDNPVAQHDAQIQLARIVRGGVPTTAEEQMLYKNVGGLANKIPTFWAQVESGQLAPETQAAVKDVVQSADAHTQAQLDRAYQTYRKMASDPALENLRPTLNSEVKARFAAVGRDVPDVFPTSDKQTPLGSASRAVREEKNPLVRAAKAKSGQRPSLDDLAAEHGL
jgi:hypothetical protein